MAKKIPTSLMKPTSGGMLKDLVMRIKLILRLMGDRRVNFFLKFLPIASLAYLFWPADLIPGLVLPIIGAVDDAAILWLGSYLFVELCPPEVVQEHLEKLRQERHNLDLDDEIVEGEATDIEDDTP